MYDPLSFKFLWGKAHPSSSGQQSIGAKKNSDLLSTHILSQVLTRKNIEHTLRDFTGKIEILKQNQEKIFLGLMVNREEFRTKSQKKYEYTREQLILSLETISQIDELESFFAESNLSKKMTLFLMFFCNQSALLAVFNDAFANSFFNMNKSLSMPSKKRVNVTSHLPNHMLIEITYFEGGVVENGAEQKMGEVTAIINVAYTSKYEITIDFNFDKVIAKYKLLFSDIWNKKGISLFSDQKMPSSSINEISLTDLYYKIKLNQR